MALINCSKQGELAIFQGMLKERYWFRNLVEPLAKQCMKAICNMNLATVSLYLWSLHIEWLLHVFHQSLPALNCFDYAFSHCYLLPITTSYCCYYFFSCFLKIYLISLWFCYNLNILSNRFCNNRILTFSMNRADVLNGIWKSLPSL